MAVELFPHALTRKQYGLRLIALFVFFMIGVFLWVGALISGVVFIGWVAIGWIYAAAGLAAGGDRAVDGHRPAGRGGRWARAGLRRGPRA